jgi:hypothetical protein
MLDIDFPKTIALIIVIIFLGYIAIRIWTYGYFRSYFDAKKQHNINKKEDDDAEAK